MINLCNIINITVVIITYCSNITAINKYYITDICNRSYNFII